MVSKLIQLLFASLFVLHVAAQESPIAGRPTFIPEWEIAIYPDQAPLKFNGTIQEVQFQIEQRYPEWYQTNIKPVMDAAASQALQPAGLDISKRDLEARATFLDQDIHCKGFPKEWNYAGGWAIEKGIAYLRGLNGKPGNGAGPGACGQVSCAYNSAIWWCNDNPYYYELSSWGDIADGAEAGFKKCKVNITFGSFHGVYVISHVFHVNNWNVITHNASC